MDYPGFGASQGPAQDIINAANIYQVLQTPRKYLLIVEEGWLEISDGKLFIDTLKKNL